MIKNIVFDMGQVLIHWCPDILMKHFDLTPEEKTLLVQELFHSVEWVQLDHGTISFEEAVRRINCRLPEKIRPYAAELVQNWWNRTLVPMEGMAELIAQLKEAGYRMYLLSNANLVLREYFPRIPGSQYFTGLMVSAEEKLLKPQHEIYECLYNRFDLNPAECLFIDDNPANIEGAVCTGMNGIVFRGDVNRLRRDLAENGVRF